MSAKPHSGCFQETGEVGNRRRLEVMIRDGDLGLLSWAEGQFRRQKPIGQRISNSRAINSHAVGDEFTALQLTQLVSLAALGGIEEPKAVAAKQDQFAPVLARSFPACAHAGFFRAPPYEVHG